MNMQNDNFLNLDDTKDLLVEMEQEDAITLKSWANLNLRFAQKMVFESQGLAVKGGKRLSREEYDLIDKMVIFCQSPFRAAVSTNVILETLEKIYDPLISYIAKQMYAGDSEEWKNIAQTIFRRMVTGDTPNTIRVYEKHTIGTAVRTVSTYEDLSDKRVPNLAKEFTDGLDNHIKSLTDYELSEDQIKAIKVIYDNGKEHFAEILPLRRKDISFGEFVCNRLDYELGVARSVAKHGRTPEARKKFADWAHVIECYLLVSPRCMKEYIEKSSPFWENAFKEFVKDAHRENRYSPKRGMKFTNYIRIYLKRALLDIYKSKPYQKSHGGNAYEQTIDDVEIDMHTSINIKRTRTSEDFLPITDLDFDLFLKRLTTQQRKVAQLMKDGYRPMDIARLLNISRPMVTKYRRKIKEKHNKFNSD
jgi:hypothetical protein